MKTKIYLAGKITGDPNYKAKFEAAAEEYKKKGLHRTVPLLVARRNAVCRLYAYMLCDD